MYILIIPSWYFPVDSEEITGRMFHDLAKGLRERDLDARIFYPEFSLQGTIFSTSGYITEQSVPTFRVQQWFPPKKNSFLLKWWIRKSARALLRYIRDYGRPDVIHAQSYFAAMVAAEASKKLSIPFIYTERLSSFLTGQIPKFHQKFFKPVFALASIITCVSPGMLDVLQPHAPRPIRVVPNFYDEIIFHPDPTITKNEVFTFVSIGEPAHTKGLDILFHAFAALKRKLKPLPLRLMMIDRIPEEYELNKLALSLQIDKDIHWMGLMSQEGIALLLNSSHALVSSSRVETFGKVMIEALACGVPVIATKTDGAKFILSVPAQGEFAEINNADSLQQAMGKVVTGYAHYKPDIIVDMVRKRFSKKVILDQWISLYNSVIS